MINIVLAEDQGLLRGALGTLLGLEPDIKVVAESENGEQAYQDIKALCPDICVIDIEMPMMTGLDVAEKLLAEADPCKIIILTTFARPGYFQRAMKAKVYGYLLKDSPSSELADAIRRVYDGKRMISNELSFSVWEDTNPLSKREREVLQLAASGLTANDIALKLFLSHGTVRNYISEIIQKIDAKNRVEAISIARNKGWLN
jgi:two-component system response regulator DesR